MVLVGGFTELIKEFRALRDGKDCVWNVIVSIAVSSSLLFSTWWFVCTPNNLAFLCICQTQPSMICCGEIPMTRTAWRCFILCFLVFILANITTQEARGLRGLANHGLNDAKIKVSLSSDPDATWQMSGTHSKTSTPLFDEVFKVNFVGQVRRKEGRIHT
jgi:hypothetical protein